MALNPANSGNLDQLALKGQRLLVIPASLAECERHFNAFNARHIIIISQCNTLFPETVEALSIVLERHKTSFLR